MGTSIGGVISPPIPGFDVQMLSKLLQCKLQPVDKNPTWKSDPKSDIHNKNDVGLYWNSKFVVIANDALSSDLLFCRNFEPYDRFLSITGVRGKVVFFCIYDSGDTYGFSMFENGHAIRHRLYSLGGQGPQSFARGDPLAIEQSWHPVVLTEEEKQDFAPEEWDEVFQHQESGKLLTEHGLSSFLVDAILQDEFGFSPINWKADHGAIQGQCYRAVLEEQAKADGPWWRRIVRGRRDFPV